eukprot:COSAG04_NODE_7419_length_1131_cov_2.161822_2_plen_95_part_00
MAVPQGWTVMEAPDAGGAAQPAPTVDGGGTDGAAAGPPGGGAEAPTPPGADAPGGGSDGNGGGGDRTPAAPMDGEAVQKVQLSTDKHAPLTYEC